MLLLLNEKIEANLRVSYLSLFQYFPIDLPPSKSVAENSIDEILMEVDS